MAEYELNAGVRHGNDKIESFAGVLFPQKPHKRTLSIRIGKKIQVKAFTKEGDVHLVVLIKDGFYRAVDLLISRGGPALFGKDHQDFFGICSVAVTNLDHTRADRQQAGKNNSGANATFEWEAHAGNPFLQGLTGWVAALWASRTQGQTAPSCDARQARSCGRKHFLVFHLSPDEFLQRQRIAVFGVMRDHLVGDHFGSRDIPPLQVVPGKGLEIVQVVRFEPDGPA